MLTIPAKTIVTRTKGTGWFGCAYNMNIYRGCSHGCIYCDSRSDCYQNPDFDTIKVKENALEIIRSDLRRKVKPGVVGTGAMSDPYNPLEKESLLTRHALELLSAYGFGVAVDTKSDLVVRDIDLFQEIAEHSPVLIKMTITCGDALAEKLEPHVASPSHRFAALRALSDAGIPCGVLLMPVLPFLTDSDENLLDILHLTKESGAKFVYPGLGVTMRDGQREYFLKKLEALFPGMGERYQSAFGLRYHCATPRAQHLWKLFTKTCDDLGLLYNMADIISLYQTGYESTQLSFF